MAYSVQTITITLASLADTAWRQSTARDNTSDGFLDAHVGGSIRVGTGPITNGGKINIFLYGSYDGTNYTAGASGSDAAYTADGEQGLLLPLEQIVVDSSTGADYVFGPISAVERFGMRALPEKWGVIVENTTGDSLDSTGGNHHIKFNGIT